MCSLLQGGSRDKGLLLIIDVDKVILGDIKGNGGCIRVDSYVLYDDVKDLTSEGIHRFVFPTHSENVISDLEVAHRDFTLILDDDNGVTGKTNGWSRGRSRWCLLILLHLGLEGP